MGTLICVLNILFALLGLWMLAWVLYSVLVTIVFVRENGVRASLKIFSVCALLSTALTCTLYYLPWQGWVVLGLLLFCGAVGGAGAACRRTPPYPLRPGFYSKVFDPFGEEED